MDRWRFKLILLGVGIWIIAFAVGERTPFLRSDELLITQKWILFPALMLFGITRVFLQRHIFRDAARVSLRKGIGLAGTILTGLFLLSATIAYSVGPVVAFLADLLPGAHSTQRYLVIGQSNMRSTGPRAYYEWKLKSNSNRNFTVPLRLSEFSTRMIELGSEVCLVGKENSLGTVVITLQQNKSVC